MVDTFYFESWHNTPSNQDNGKTDFTLSNLILNDFSAYDWCFICHSIHHYNPKTLNVMVRFTLLILKIFTICQMLNHYEFTSTKK